MRNDQTRNLHWDGCFNVRDLGGLPIADGGATRWGAFVRADALARLSADGWESLVAHGVRTVVDLRNDGERVEDTAPRPDSLTTIHLPLDVSDDREFWDVWESGPQFGTPLYFGPHLRRFPQRNAEVAAAIARAEPGGVAFHCVGGRDRSGQVAMTLLALAGVEPQAIAADYALSAERLRPLYAQQGREDENAVLEAFLRERGTTAEQAIIETLAGMDVELQLIEGGLSVADLEALRARLIDPTPTGAPA